MAIQGYTGCINLNAIFDNLKSFPLIFPTPINLFTVSVLIQLMLSLNIFFMKIFDLNWLHLNVGLHSSLLKKKQMYTIYLLNLMSPDITQRWKVAGS